MRYVVYILASAVVIFSVMLMGQLLAGSSFEFLWFDTKYITSLGPEIGGSGLDAFLVGTLAGYISSRFTNDHELNGFKRSLRRRRQANRPISLRAATERWSSGLDLSGFAFKREKLNDGFLQSVWFCRGGRFASFTEVQFENVMFTRVRFGASNSGASLDACQFSECSLKYCDFRNVKIANSVYLFDGSRLDRCMFDGAHLQKSSLKEAALSGCSFWGATLEYCSIPQQLFAKLDNIGALIQVQEQEPVYKVISWCAFMRGLNLKRLQYLFDLYVRSR